jgi:hypothetical protein
MKNHILLLLIMMMPCVLLAAPPVPPPRVEVPGKRIAVTSASIFVPAYYMNTHTTSTNLVVFIHGAAWVAEQEFYRSRRNAILLTASIPSGRYREYFGASNGLRRLMEDTSRALARENITSLPLGRLCVASFSGGYAAVQAILATTGSRELVTDVVLADSLYPPRIGPEELLSEPDLAPVLAFAKSAADSSGTTGPTFTLSHLFPPEEKYRSNTTSRAALWLIDKIGAVRKEDGVSTTSRGQRILYKAEKGRFLVWGVGGMTTQDHFEHFYGIGDLLERTNLPRLQQP